MHTEEFVLIPKCKFITKELKFLETHNKKKAIELSLMQRNNLINEDDRGNNI